MIRRIQSYFTGVSPTFIDGLLYVLIAFFGASITGLNAEEAYKYINPFVLYWLKFFATLGLASVTALKMFRSTSYAEHQEKKAELEKESK